MTGKRLYRQGRCDAMALALHRVTGLPLVAIMGETQQPNGRWCREPAHVAVSIDDRRWIDVDGEHRGIPPRTRLRFLREPQQITLRPVTEKRVRYMYTVSGVPEQEVLEALHFIAHDPKLRSLVKRHS